MKEEIKIVLAMQIWSHIQLEARKCSFYTNKDNVIFISLQVDKISYHYKSLDGLKYNMFGHCNYFLFPKDWKFETIVDSDVVYQMHIPHVSCSTFFFSFCKKGHKVASSFMGNEPINNPNLLPICYIYYSLLQPTIQTKHSLNDIDPSNYSFCSKKTPLLELIFFFYYKKSLPFLKNIEKDLQMCVLMIQIQTPLKPKNW